MRWLVWVSLHQRLGYLQACLRRICLTLLHYLHFWLLDAYGRISTRRTIIIQKQYITYQLIYESVYFIPRERYRIGCEISKSVIKIDVIPHDCECVNGMSYSITAIITLIPSKGMLAAFIFCTCSRVSLISRYPHLCNIFSFAHTKQKKTSLTCKDGTQNPNQVAK